MGTKENRNEYHALEHDKKKNFIMVNKLIKLIVKKKK